MIKSMIKSILKLFLPKSSTFAKIASETICKNINNLNQEDTIKKYTEYADEVTKIQSKLVDMLKDGKLDEADEETIALLLEPIFEKIIDLI